MAPIAIVARKAMMRTGTARRSAGSATRSRRYAGLAIDCARPLIESALGDALARAGAMPSLPLQVVPATLFGQDVPHLFPNHVHWNPSANLCRESRSRIFKIFLQTKKLRESPDSARVFAESR